MDHEGIAIRGGHHCAMLLMSILGVTGSSRASSYIYNTRDEIDLLVEGIKKSKKLMQEILNKTKELGMTSVAITDHVVYMDYLNSPLPCPRYQILI